MAAKLNSIDWLLTSIVVGIVLLVLGLQLRAIEAFVCTPETTQLLSKWTGPDEQTAQGAFQRLVVEKTERRHVVKPPNWLGWAVLSIGFVLTVHGLWGKWRR